MATTTFTGVVRSGKHLSAGVVSLNAVISFDPTKATHGTGFVLPKGAVLTGIESLGGSTGGASPTVDVGIDGTPAYFADELEADAYTVGTLLKPGPLAEDTEVFVGVGTSAATGGETIISIQYYRTV